MGSLIIPKDDRDKYITNILGIDREKKKREKLKKALSDPITYVDESEKRYDLIVADNVKKVFNDVYSILVDEEDFPEDEARIKALQIVNPYKAALNALFKELYPESYKKLANKSAMRIKVKVPAVAAVAGLPDEVAEVAEEGEEEEN